MSELKQFSSIKDQKKQVVDQLMARHHSAPEEISCVVSPYRIAPIGAHVDHQGGQVLGAAINAFTIFAFAPNGDGQVCLSSPLFEVEERFDVADPTVGDKGGWARYARGAAHALAQFHEVKIGLNGVVNGMLLGAGLSSSASVGLAYLLALAAVNDINLSKEELVELDRIIENDYLGLKNGVQDQTTITYAEITGLIHQDTRTRTVTQLSHAEGVANVCWLVVYSGYSRELVSSGFNDRVSECETAARLLDPDASILSDVSPDFFAINTMLLPPDLALRAAHYFSEVGRVSKGAELWQSGDFKRFGELMNASCHSSINQYQCGSRPLIDLHKIAKKTDGVLGSRFSGGGYGGCLVALVERDKASDAADNMMRRYRRKYPEKAEIAAAYLAEMDDGLRLL